MIEGSIDLAWAESPLRCLDAQERAALTSSAKIISLPQGHQVAARDALVVDGLARLLVTSHSARRLTLQYLPPSSLVRNLRGELRTDVAIEALNQTTVLALEAGRLDVIAHDHPQLADALAQHWRHVVSHAVARLESMLSRSVEQRLARDLLTLSSLTRHGVIALTQQQLADSVGTAREVATRAIGRFIRDGAIQRHISGIRVSDPAALELLAS